MFKFHVDCFSQTEPVTVPSNLKIRFMWVAPAETLEVGYCLYTKYNGLWPFPTYVDIAVSSYLLLRSYC